MSGDAQDEAVRAVATNNWVADTVRSDAEGLTKKSAAAFLKRLETLFEKVGMMLAHAACEEAALCLLASHILPGTWHNEAFKGCTCITKLQGVDTTQETIRCYSVPGPGHGLRHELPSAPAGPSSQAEGQPPEKVVRAAAGSALLKL